MGMEKNDNRDSRSAPKNREIIFPSHFFVLNLSLFFFPLSVQKTPKKNKRKYLPNFQDFKFGHLPKRGTLLIQRCKVIGFILTLRYIHNAV